MSSDDDEETEGSYLSDETEERMQTPHELMEDASFRGHAADVRRAIRYGAYVDCLINDSWDYYDRCTPLFEACSQGNDKIVRILLDAGADAHQNVERGWSAMWEACRLGHLSTVQILIRHDLSLLENTNDEGTTPLFAAILNNRVDVVRFLKDCGANVHATDPETGETTLMYACSRKRKHLKIVRLLLAAGVDVHARDKRQRTALHHIALGRYYQAARELILRHNANMFFVDKDGKTPFELARKTKRPRKALNHLFEMYYWKMTQDLGRLALHGILNEAEYSFPEPKSFQPPQNPLRIHLPLGTLTLKYWRTLFRTLDTELIRNRDDNGKLPIHIACETNAPFEVLAMLVAVDPATLQIADYTGALPMHECCRESVDCTSVRYLVEQGGVGTLAARNHQGALPLHNLCGSLNPPLRTVQYLVQSFPVSVSMRTNAGEYPFMVAASSDSSSASLSVVYELVRASPNLIVPK